MNDVLGQPGSVIAGKISERVDLVKRIQKFALSLNAIGSSHSVRSLRAIVAAIDTIDAAKAEAEVAPVLPDELDPG